MRRAAAFFPVLACVFLAACGEPKIECENSAVIGTLSSMVRDRVRRVVEDGYPPSYDAAKRARLAYRLRPGDGVAYLDPYGDSQRQRWLDFKVDMEATGFEPAEIAVIADAAKLMFQSLTSILDEIVAVERITRRAPAM